MDIIYVNEKLVRIIHGRAGYRMNGLNFKPLLQTRVEMFLLHISVTLLEVGENCEYIGQERVSEYIS